MLQPVLQEIATVGQRDFAVPTACVSDTCRLWSLLHTLAGETLRRELPADDLVSRETLVLQAASPTAVLSAVRGFLSEFFKCMYCRNHFLEQFDAGSYGLALARNNSAETVLYFWRLHNAVSVRIAAEQGCNSVDRRWPPLSVCAKCWDVMAVGDWDVLSETRKISGGDDKKRSKGSAGDKAIAIAAAAQGLPRALQLRAMPNEEEILRFLMTSFSEEKPQVDTLAAPSAPAVGDGGGDATAGEAVAS